MNYICPITRDQFTDNQNIIQIKYCKHNFYPDSLLMWFREHVHCPLCRYDIRDYNTENTDEAYINTTRNTITQTLHNQLNGTFSDLSRNNTSNNDYILEYSIHPYITQHV